MVVVVVNQQAEKQYQDIKGKMDKS